MFRMRSTLVRGSLAVLALCAGLAGQAHARIFVGVGVPLFVGPPLIVPPPVYYPPYYAPPMGYGQGGSTFSYTPPQNQPTNLAPPSAYSRARACHAGAYVCPLIQDTPTGAPCGCPGHDGQMVRGQAD